MQAQQILEKYTILSAAYHGDDLNGVSDCHLYQKKLCWSHHADCYVKHKVGPKIVVESCKS